jgi:hypothetical protein
MKRDDDWALVYTTGDEMEAYIVKGFLETNEIPCSIDNLRVHELPVAFGDLSKLNIFVPAAEKDNAEQLLKQLDERYLVCDKCGAQCFEDDKFCRNCGEKFDIDEE